MSSDSLSQQDGKQPVSLAQLEEGLSPVVTSHPQQRQNNSDSPNISSPGHSGSNSPPTLQTQPGSAKVRPPRERHRVRFGLGEGGSQDQSRSGSTSRDQSRSGGHSRSASGDFIVNIGGTTNPRGALKQSGSKPKPKPLPLPRAGPSSSFLDGSQDISDSPSPFTSPQLRQNSIEDGDELEDTNADPESTYQAEYQADRARYRAERLSRSLDPNRLSRSAPGSKLPSPSSSGVASPEMMSNQTPALPRDMTDLIPMEELQQRRKKYGIEDDTDSEEEHEEDQLQPKQNWINRTTTAARRLIKTHSSGKEHIRNEHYFESRLSSGQVTPIHDRGDPDNYFPPPDIYKGGVLGALLNIEKGGQGQAGSSRSLFADSQTATANATPMTTPGGSPNGSPLSSGRATPKKKPPRWHEKKSSLPSFSANQSRTSLAGLINSSNMLAGPGIATGAATSRPPLKSVKRNSGAIETLKSFGKKDKKAKEYHIQHHIEDILARQQFIVNCCRALMKYGAPTHRLEEYLRYLSRVLQIKTQTLYIPGCMLISFDDPTTHTTEMKIVRENQGVDLGKLTDLHDVYKAVTHDKYGVKEASESLDSMAKQPQRFPPWVCVFLYGCASATVGPFAFGARPIDMPIAFFLGALLGYMQLVLAPRSELYSNVFEITAAVVTSFLARAFGSIRGGDLFCFSALAQSAIALILPGYMVLGAALELQSKNVVAGAVRMVYAIIYSLFLGFGITIGTTFYGAIDNNATSETTCRTEPIHGTLKFIFVPFFTLCLSLVNQAKWKQIPMMIAVSFAGYVVNFYSALRFASNAQVATTLGALAIGVIANLYSRVGQGVSAAALLPAIFVQVPSGLAATGSLISGVSTADQIVSNVTASAATSPEASDGGVVFNVAYNMIQIAVGLTVGLFLSALIIYPLGKKRSGLFSF